MHFHGNLSHFRHNSAFFREIDEKDSSMTFSFLATAK
jgi:hypothetical protein